MNEIETITIRHSTGDDAAAIRRLADLDGRPVPDGELLLALAGGELRAAMPLDGGEALADPFHHSAVLVELLRARALLERRGTPRRGGRIRLRPALVGR
jgi:hypothetical protein